MINRLRYKMMKPTYQTTILESIKHLEVSSGFAPLEIGDMLPEAINSRQCHQPLRVELPGVPVNFMFRHKECERMLIESLA